LTDSPFLSSSIVLTSPLGYSNDMNKLFFALVVTLLFGLLLSTASISAEVYKKVNPDGSVEFTDAPKSKDATPVPLSPTNTFKATPAPPISSSQKSKPTANQYTSASITSPSNDAAIRDNAGNLTVTASVTPSLQSDHKMVLMDNGVALSESTSGSFQLSNVDRGSHSLSIQVQDSAGKVIISSDPVTVHLLRHSTR